MQAGVIGPNAVTQLLAVLADAGQAEVATRLMARAGCAVPDLDKGLIDEAPVARLHQALRTDYPDEAAGWAAAAGTRTADYILARRIPKAAQGVLKALPAVLSAPLLARAIAKNAWTFAGSGRFRVVSTRPITFEIADNPVVRGETADHPLCDWHAAVFTRLFQVLVDRRLVARETECCATGAPACRFEITRA
ncbi:MAG: bacteriochlorophyll 4-vinyl reductase [Limimaricola sp.]|uniref:bacteriochlorophyll 4-vinyl reductase n=1 Tax=Limimaricola sp. TaxID=2211665 RepID=UPI001D21A7B2|nr:bacteriochlorophyll 4-vinyl reductase [Limimaricola sp.]MBI1416484.1 bacteriochlorophyll 4-vinyl reductase [Limimaricola sp.]